jgi:hypothetical protein
MNHLYTENYLKLSYKQNQVSQYENNQQFKGFFIHCRRRVLYIGGDSYVIVDVDVSSF